MNLPARKTLVLASASPRRQALLAQIGVAVLQQPVSLDETPLPAEAAADCAQRLARAKATRVWQSLPASLHGGSVVLGADTVVVARGVRLGKPAGETEALEMLGRLQGRTHEVWTGLAVVRGGEQRTDPEIAEGAVARPLGIQCGSRIVQENRLAAFRLGGKRQVRKREA